MFDTNINRSNSSSSATANNNLKITACSGGIYKTYKSSWFEKLKLNSDKANLLLSKNPVILVNTDKYEKKYTYKKDYSGSPSRNPRYGQDDYNSEPTISQGERIKEEKEVTILQMVICGDMEVIAEIITIEDYNTETKL